MFNHASAIEIVLALIALSIFVVVLLGVRAARHDVKNIVTARSAALPDLIFPRGSMRSAQQALRRQRYNLALALVFVMLTTYALEVAPPPPGTFWSREQFTFGKGWLFIGMTIVGLKALSERHARREILDAIIEDTNDRRRSTGRSAHPGEF